MILTPPPRGKRRDTVGAFRPKSPPALHTLFLSFSQPYIRIHQQCTRGESNKPIVAQ
jgi:hypothetical protein